MVMKQPFPAGSMEVSVPSMHLEGLSCKLKSKNTRKKSEQNIVSGLKFWITLVTQLKFIYPKIRNSFPNLYARFCQQYCRGNSRKKYW